MTDRNKFINFCGKWLRQLAFTNFIPEDNKVYGIQRDGDIQIGKLVEISGGSGEVTANDVIMANYTI